MSMNIHLLASASAKLSNNGIDLGERKISERFECFQTPTEITRQILKSDNPEKTYIKWVYDTFYKNERVELYDESYDSDLNIVKGEYLGYYISNNGRDHIKQLSRFLKKHEGWNIEWYEL